MDKAKQRQLRKAYRAVSELLGRSVPMPSFLEEEVQESKPHQSFWTIVETDYEYDDQRYNPNGERPTNRVYRSKERAQQECNQRNFEFLQDNDVSYFGWDGDDIITERGLEILRSVAPMLLVHRDNFPDNYEELLTGNTQDRDLIGQIVKELLNSPEFAQAQELADEILVSPFRVHEVFLEE